MKSLLITGVFPPRVGGSGRWLWEVYSRLPRERYAIVAGEHPQAEEFDRTHDLNVRRLPLAFSDLGYFGLPGYLQYRRLARVIAQQIKGDSIKAIHCGALLPDAWIGRMLARKFKLPLLVYMHGEETCYANASRQLNWMGQRILRDATLVIANSKNTETICRERWNVESARIRVLHPGVDCTRFVPAPRVLGVRERLGWGDRPVVLTVGRLQPRKGQDMLIRALPEIVRAIPNVLYAIVGDGDDYERLLGLSRELGVEQHVRFHRDLADDDLVRCYQQCDLFALPNRQIGNDIEGFGMVLVEAQACGKPVLAGNSGGTAETMQPGVTGEIIDCTEPAQVAAKIVDFLRNGERLEQMGDAGRVWVKEKFDWPVLTAEAREGHAELFAKCQIVCTTRASVAR